MLPVRKRPFGVLGHDGGTGGFTSGAGFVSEIDTAVAFLASSSRAVDRLGLEILEPILEPAVD